jgi:hypothetical protein
MQDPGASRCGNAEVRPTVVAREGGRSSIPETLMMDTRSRGVLDTPHARGMTDQGFKAMTSLRGMKATKQSSFRIAGTDHELLRLGSQ